MSPALAGGFCTTITTWEAYYTGLITGFSSVAQSCPTLCDPMNHSTPGLPIHHQLLEFIQTHEIGRASCRENSKLVHFIFSFILSFKLQIIHNKHVLHL